MALTAGLYISGLVLVSWAAKTSFAQSYFNCNWHSGQTVTASKSYNKTAISPNYPSNYDNNLECTLLIKVDISLSFHGYVVKVTFNDFRLQQARGSRCEDVLKFYDGMNAVSSLLGSYCGTTYPEVIYSTGQYLYVKFHTNDFFSYKGFSFSFSAVKKEEASGICRPWDGSNNIHRLSGSSGTFFTPDYPVSYPDDARCIWIISVPAGKRVKLKFDDLNLDTVYSSCKQQIDEKDYVQIRDGQVQESKELALHCGYLYDASNPSDVYSTGRYMWVKFYSNSQSSWRDPKGFKAHFEAVDLLPTSNELCLTGNIYNNDLKLTGSYGTLQSPQDSHKWYPPGSSCDWLITAPEGKIVKLRFDRFEVQPKLGSRCTADYVEVFDGKSSYSGSKGRFCGYSKPDDIHSSGRYMWVRFRADHSSSYNKGFKATFTAEDKPSSSTMIIAIVVSLIVFIGLICCIVCIVKHKKKPSAAAGARIPMSASHTAQPGVIQHPPPPATQPPYQPAAIPYPPPPVGYAPVPPNPSLPGAGSPYAPYPPEPPPPYPGDETAPQYPPPGQSYPWLQSTPVKASAPPESP